MTDEQILAIKLRILINEIDNFEREDLDILRELLDELKGATETIRQLNKIALACGLAEGRSKLKASDREEIALLEALEVENIIALIEIRLKLQEYELRLMGGLKPEENKLYN